MAPEFVGLAMVSPSGDIICSMRILVLALAGLLAACSSEQESYTWRGLGSKADFDRNDSECQTQALDLTYQDASLGSNPRRVGIGRMIEIQGAAKQSYIRCMQSRGYQLVPK